MTTDLFSCERGGVGAVRKIKYEKLIGIFPNISQMSLSLGIIWEFSQTTPKKMKG